MALRIGIDVASIGDNTVLTATEQTVIQPSGLLVVHVGDDAVVATEGEDRSPGGPFRG
jgi:hypothetical protein